MLDFHYFYHFFHTVILRDFVETGRIAPFFSQYMQNCTNRLAICNLRVNQLLRKMPIQKCVSSEIVRTVPQASLRRISQHCKGFTSELVVGPRWQKTEASQIFIPHDLSIRHCVGLATRMSSLKQNSKTVIIHE